MNRYFKTLKAVFRSFDARTQLLVIALLVIFLASVIGILAIFNNRLLEPVAAPGGSLSEGIIGTPRFINPLLAVSDADRDLTALVYSGLMRMGPNSQLIPDLAESYSISDDGLVYTFILKRGLVWQDGEKLTTSDIEFTISRAQDPLVKSVRRASWEGVKVEKVSEREIRFHLKQPYVTFLDTTAMGILPKHLWSEISPNDWALSDLNLKGVGSGPYQVAVVKKDSEGLPLYYELAPFTEFALGAPKLDKIMLRFYAGENDLLASYKRGEIESLAAVPPVTAAELAKGGASVLTAPLPRIFAIFFQQSEAPIFTNKEVRAALNLATPKEQVINQVLQGYGKAIDGPLPPGVIGFTDSGTSTVNLAAATEVLTKAGWKKNANGIWEKKDKKSSLKLAFKLTTASTPELKDAAEIIAQSWRALGAEVTLEVFEIGDLNQNIIRPRKFEALLFGEIVGANPDPFAFWHSSQRLDPGLNIAQYTNSAADKLLAEARAATDNKTRADKLTKFVTEIKKDNPAVFIYTPDFIYIVPERIKGLKLSGLTTPADRFNNVFEWHLNTERVWPIFAH